MSEDMIHVKCVFHGENRGPKWVNLTKKGLGQNEVFEFLTSIVIKNEV